MDRELFSGMVREMLLRDGAVEFPGLGNLQFQTCPASFSDRGFTLNPPFRKLVFVQEGRNSAGLAAVRKPSALSSLYASANGISMDRAVIVVAETLEELIAELTPLHDCGLPGLGRFRMMRDGSLFFVQDQSVELCPAYDILRPVSLKSLDKETSAVTTAPSAAAVVNVADDHPAAPSEASEPSGAVEKPVCRKKGRGRRAVLWTVCSAVVLLAVFFAALAILGRTDPQLVDPLLYSEQQLDVLYLRF